ncbi:hypothetical protein LY78DRAFT_310244 [Colletotrichum sublineola]|nr:hypothetical protein LY78DRAFT_310244 [Colletotrichum sublineola]
MEWLFCQQRGRISRRMAPPTTLDPGLTQHSIPVVSRTLPGPGKVQIAPGPPSLFLSLLGGNLVIVSATLASVRKSLGPVLNQYAKQRCASPDSKPRSDERQRLPFARLIDSYSTSPHCRFSNCRTPELVWQEGTKSPQVIFLFFVWGGLSRPRRTTAREP